MISKERFENIKDKYGDVSSWAVWKEVGDKPKSNIGDITIFNIKINPNILNTLNPNIIMVGLNFSREITHVEKFINFHDSNPKGQDYKLRYVFENTSYYGAYMTDIIKNFVMLNSVDVKTYLNNNQNFLIENILNFQKEIKEIGAKNPIILAFGNYTYNILEKNLDKKYYSKLIKITHYSHHISKENYKKRVLIELKSNIEKQIN